MQAAGSKMSEMFEIEVVHQLKRLGERGKEVRARELGASSARARRELGCRPSPQPLPTLALR